MSLEATPDNGGRPGSGGRRQGDGKELRCPSAERYSSIISRAFSLLLDYPDPEIREGVRSFHLELAAGKRGAASHIIYYRVRPDSEGERELLVLRLLSDWMEPKYRVSRALGTDDSVVGNDPSSPE
jgi:toxin ParE1/3/4